MMHPKKTESIFIFVLFLKYPPGLIGKMSTINQPDQSYRMTTSIRRHSSITAMNIPAAVLTVQHAHNAIDTEE
jgi:hypothetical protein